MRNDEPPMNKYLLCVKVQGRFVFLPINVALSDINPLLFENYPAQECTYINNHMKPTLLVEVIANVDFMSKESNTFYLHLICHLYVIMGRCKCWLAK